MILLCALTLSICGKEQFPNKESNAINNKIQTIYLKSKVSNQIMPVSLPNCVIWGISGQHVENEKLFGNGITLHVDRLAFSQPKFDGSLKCVMEQHSKSADIYAIFPLDDKEKRMLQSDPFEYSLHKATVLGASYLGSKNGMALYKTSPVSDSIFIQKNFISVHRPLSISFIRFNNETPNSSFRYYFNIYTILKGGYRLTYEVVANAKTPSQFAEKLRNTIESNENVLDHPEIIAEFVENNEKIADFFELNISK